MTPAKASVVSNPANADVSQGGYPEAMSESTLRHPVGLATAAGEFTPLIPAGTPLPTEFRDTFSVAANFQTAIGLDMFQLREGQLHCVGRARIEDLPATIVGAPACVLTITITAERWLSLQARLPSLGVIRAFGFFRVDE